MPKGDFKYKTFEEFEKKVNDYFEKNDLYTLTGLHLHVQLYHENYNDYAKRGVEWKQLIDWAKHRVALQHEENLLTSKKNIVGSIFWLKNNMGWLDANIVNQNVKLENVTLDMSLNPKRKTEYGSNNEIDNESDSNNNNEDIELDDNSNNNENE